MTKEDMKLKLTEIGKEYQDEEITIGNDIFHIYYIFKAGQIGWEKYFDSFSDSQKNFEKAKEHLLKSFGYCGRNSSLIAIKKCYCISNNKKEEVFNFSK